MEWISVKDRLPEDGDECFILLGKLPFLSKGRPHITGGYVKNGIWYTLDGDEIDFNPATNMFAMRITHWMKIPEIPKD